MRVRDDDDDLLLIMCLTIGYDGELEAGTRSGVGLDPKRGAKTTAKTKPQTGRYR